MPKHIAEQFEFSDIGTFEAMIKSVVNEIAGVVCQRQAKYGPHNINRHGLTGIAVRLGDKLARLDNAVINKQGAEVPDESVNDTLTDIAGYAIIALCLQKKLWRPDFCPPLNATADLKKAEPLRNDTGSLKKESASSNAATPIQSA